MSDDALDEHGFPITSLEQAQRENRRRALHVKQDQPPRGPITGQLPSWVDEMRADLERRYGDAAR